MRKLSVPQRRVLHALADGQTLDSEMLGVLALEPSGHTVQVRTLYALERLGYVDRKRSITAAGRAAVEGTNDK